MGAIFKMITQHTGASLILIIACFVACLLTLMLFFLVRGMPFVKYVPGLVFTAIGIFNLIRGFSKLLEMSGLDSLSNAMVFGTSGLVSLCLAGILAVIDHRIPRTGKDLKMKAQAKKR